MQVQQRNRAVGVWVAVIVLIIIGLIGWAWYAFVSNNSDNQETITNYEECVAGGYPIMETYPEQCRDGRGQTFVRDISNETRQYEYISENGVKIEVVSPDSGETVTSPFVVEGRVPGSWSFEASFPIELFDENGNSLAIIPAQLQADWMTEELVEFIATIEVAGYRGPATLVLRKDNPSGLTENDDFVEIPIVLR